MRAIDKLIANLLKYANRPEWQELLDDVYSEHLDAAAKVLDLPVDELSARMQARGLGQALLGVIFEDFISVPHPGMENRSLAETYLKRAAWREPPRARKYLESLAATPMSLYEVLNVQRDRGFELRDLLSDKPAFFVREKAATHGVARWDILAARTPSDLNERVLGGGLLRLERESALGLVELLKSTLAEARDAEDAALVWQSVPIHAVSLWLVQLLRKDESPLPTLVTAEGDAVLFGEARFPLLAPAEDVAARLDGAPDWQRAGDQPPFWNWLGSEAMRGASGSRGSAMETVDSSGSRLYGSIELRGDQLLFCATSRPRMEAGLARLTGLLGATVGQPMTSYQTPAQAMAQRQEGGSPGAPPDMAPEELAAIEREFMDQHYRKTFKSRIPALDDKTPAQAMRSKAGRCQVIEWLKYLENGEAKRVLGSGKTPYDFTWMWRELGLESERG